MGYVTRVRVRVSDTIRIGYADTHFLKTKPTKMVYPSIRIRRVSHTDTSPPLEYPCNIDHGHSSPELSNNNSHIIMNVRGAWNWLIFEYPVNWISYSRPLKYIITDPAPGSDPFEFSSSSRSTALECLLFVAGATPRWHGSDRWCCRAVQHARSTQRPRLHPSLPDERERIKYLLDLWIPQARRPQAHSGKKGAARPAGTVVVSPSTLPISRTFSAARPKRTLPQSR